MQSTWLKLIAVAVFVEIFGLLAGTPSSLRFLGHQFSATFAYWSPPTLVFKSEFRPQSGSLNLYGTGTAIAVSNDGYALTNAHVVNDCSLVTVSQRGKESEAEVVRRSQSYDLSLLRVSLENISTTRRFQIGHPQLGEAVVVFGYPLSSLLSQSGNLTKGNVSALDGGVGRPHLMQLSAPVQSGNSGSGVFNSRGELIGLIESKLDSIRAAKALGDLPQNVNFAVTSEYLLSVFPEYEDYPKGLPPHVQPFHDEEDLYKSIQDSSFLVRCYKEKGR
jgi:S1-C subfamily serine protease